MGNAHGEIGVTQQVIDSGLVQKGAKGIYEIEGKVVCSYCRSDFPKMLRKTPFGEVEVFSEEIKDEITIRKNYYWKENFNKLKELE